MQAIIINVGVNHQSNHDFLLQNSHIIYLTTSPSTWYYENNLNDAKSLKNEWVIGF